MVGASLGFLWYNSPPAEVFMGDVGSLAIGGALGTVAILTKQEFLLPVIGGIFILEAVSVMLQVSVFQIYETEQRRRETHFPDAPLHHHFQLSRLEGAEDRVPVSDRCDPVCFVEFFDVETALVSVLSWVFLF